MRPDTPLLAGCCALTKWTRSHPIDGDDGDFISDIPGGATLSFQVELIAIDEGPILSDWFVSISRWKM